MTTKAKLFIAASLVLLACVGVYWRAVAKDSSLSKRIVGTWEGTQAREYGPASNIVMTMIVREDHTLESRSVVYFRDGRVIPVVVQGTWKIEGGTLKSRVENSPQLPNIDSRILELSDAILVMQQRETVATMHRKNAQPAGGAYVSPAAGDPSAHP